jgi:hypothetical protein
MIKLYELDSDLRGCDGDENNNEAPSPFLHHFLIQREDICGSGNQTHTEGAWQTGWENGSSGRCRNTKRIWTLIGRMNMAHTEKNKAKLTPFFCGFGRHRDGWFGDGPNREHVQLLAKPQYHRGIPGSHVECIGS